nr:GGDEF domain-containing protein [uncultured Sphaerochaeta sp.]
MNHSFFVRTDTKKVVQETYWSKPISLAMPFKTTLGSLFKQDDEDRFNIIFSNALDHETEVFCAHIPIIEEQEQLCFFIVSAKKFVYVLALDYLANLPSSIQEAHNQVIFAMIKQFAVLRGEQLMHASEEVYNHFEEIQKLNNDLVNTQRQLQRANRKLEQLNLELNNHLVKDALTGLVSRYQYHSEMQTVIQENPQAQGLFVFIDIDDFKQVNDNYGHAIGDQYLVGFSARLASLSCTGVSIAMRIAGDEFGLYLHGMEAADEAFIVHFYENFRSQVTKSPIHTDAGDLPICCSLGMAIYNKDTTNLFELIEYADWAMYQAKRSGKNSYCVFDKKAYEAEKNEESVITLM